MRSMFSRTHPTPFPIPTQVHAAEFINVTTMRHMNVKKWTLRDIWHRPGSSLLPTLGSISLSPSLDLSLSLCSHVYEIFRGQQ